MKVSFNNYIKKLDSSVLVAKVIYSFLKEEYPSFTIGKIAKTTSGGTPSRSNPEYYNGSIPWLKSGELNDGLITKASEFITEEGLNNSSAKLHPKNTLLLAMYGATAGKTGITTFETTTNQAVCAISPNDNIDQNYLFWFLRQHRYNFISISKGGAQPNISQKVIKATLVPIPSLETQKSIANFLHKMENGDDYDLGALPKLYQDKVHKVFQTKEKGALLEQELKTQQDLISKLKQSILQEAIEGKLTEDWRAKQQDVEPASLLLERIKAEKARLLKEKKIKKQKALPAIEEEEKPFELPEGWAWCRMGSVADIQRGSSPRPKGDSRFFSKNKTKNHWISIRDISKYAIKNLLTNTDEYLTDLGTNYSRYVNINELIVAVSGSTTGKCCLTNIEGYIYDGLAVVRLIGKSIAPKYHLIYYLQMYNQMNNSKTGAAFPNINTKFLNEMMFPLPPLNEQVEIVKKIQQILNNLSELEAQVQQSLDDADLLMQVVLQEAFEQKESS